MVESSLSAWGRGGAFRKRRGRLDSSFPAGLLSPRRGWGDSLCKGERTRSGPQRLLFEQAGRPASPSPLSRGSRPESWPAAPCHLLWPVSQEQRRNTESAPIWTLSTDSLLPCSRDILHVPCRDPASEARQSRELTPRSWMAAIFRSPFRAGLESAV